MENQDNFLEFMYVNDVKPQVTRQYLRKAEKTPDQMCKMLKVFPISYFSFIVNFDKICEIKQPDCLQLQVTCNRK